MEAFIIPEYSEREFYLLDAERSWIEKIRARVEELLSENPGLLFSYLYRLDIDERKLHTILKNTSPGAIGETIANEIWLRQRQRFESKKSNPQQAMLDGWDW